ncbi:hypothetical protein GYMLUDRAFT_35501 [Collybiopsis luxurians FD-317 M1]|nr:hypothetical protein GYMLUDRAFT_35501 [Collybiopsis luxurians FD-317 M1]
MDRPLFQTIKPQRHWCLLAEIVEVKPWPFRPMFEAKDITGATFHVSFHFDDKSRGSIEEIRSGRN